MGAVVTKVQRFPSVLSVRKIGTTHVFENYTSQNVRIFGTTVSRPTPNADEHVFTIVRFEQRWNGSECTHINQLRHML